MGGKVGIIHLDRHVDTQEKDMDEIMYTCPWFPATNMPKPPPGQPGAVGDRAVGKSLALA
jgi:agmatinase